MTAAMNAQNTDKRLSVNTLITGGKQRGAIICLATGPALVWDHCHRLAAFCIHLASFLGFVFLIRQEHL